MARAEVAYDVCPTATSLTELKMNIAELILLQKMEENYWKQKSVVKWVVEGEGNTKYFHGLVKQKRCKGRIHFIEENGQRITNDEELQTSGARFFKQHLANDVGTLETEGLIDLQTISDTLDLDKLWDYP